MPTGDKLPLSVIICAKNEAANLRKNLPAILEQRYMNENGKPLYEVIVVNDASADDTAMVLQEMKKQYGHLRDITIPAGAVRTFPGKKFALSQGVLYAGNEHLLFTDADCVPAGNRWLRQMVSPFHEGKEIIAGYGGYYIENGLLNRFIRWETIHSFLQYSTYTLAGKPYMAVGRNLACTKHILQKAQAAEIWKALPSGDDDLLVSIAGTNKNTCIVCEREAFTYSKAKGSWGEWARQKQRHLSTGKYYKKHIKVLQGAYAASHAGMWLLFFVLLFGGRSVDAVLLLLVARCLLYWTLLAVTAGKLHEKKLNWFLPLFDVGWMLYNFAFSPYIIFKNRKQWK